MKKLFLLFVFLPLISWAEGGGGASPAKELFFQFLNFSIFAGLMVFFLRKPLQKLFHKRQEGFLSFEKQSLAQEKEVMAEKKLWEEKLQSLEEKFKGIQQEAIKQGESFAQRKQEELLALKERLKRELDFFIRLEKEKAKKELLEKWQARLSESLRKEFQTQATVESFQQLWIKNLLKGLTALFKN